MGSNSNTGDTARPGTPDWPAKGRIRRGAAPGRPGAGADLFVPNPKLRLREQLREVMRFKHYSVRTEESYWIWIRQFILKMSRRRRFTRT